ncbi:phosphoesterase RecJ domain-containing protein [Alkalispirochaeta americana]|uniref:Phosphoesterase RecJ domain-containing protein n=1 Tax=Alkalispirochaeta americana TaxID=159291 RepID=A0A1N6NWL3_9SPIO|nr:DHH family phosphoesterase [Alkalispirochaeta americana]SIP96471.1 phosphoesterase RecJ domain-containing protein [Alkalispirochaeta americana]
MPQDTLLEVPKELIDFLLRHSSFVIAGHKEPDADCLGTQLALGSALRRLGKEVLLVNAGPFERHEITPFEHYFLPGPESPPRATASSDLVPEAAIIVDCSSADRLGSMAEQILNLPLAVVDHHASGERLQGVHFILPEVPAATILATALIQGLGLEITREEAEWLFLGLVTDTGFFRFLAPHQHIAFTTAAKLAQRGASPQGTDRFLSSGRSWESRQLIARLLQRSERLLEGSVLLTYQTAGDEKEFGRHRDSDALYRLLLAVEGVRVVVLVKEKPKGCAISFRATDSTDMGALAASFGGGGHQKASGAFVAEPLNQFLPRLRQSLLGIA